MSRNREVWLAARKKGLGASDAAAVLGENPWKEPFEVWAEKTGRLDGVDLAEEKQHVRAGQLIEPAVARWFSMDTGYVLRNPGKYRIARHPEHPWMTATLDREIVGKRTPDVVDDDAEEVADPAESTAAHEVYGVPGILEIKTTDARFRESWADGIPLHYAIQLQHQLAVTGAPWGYVTCLIGGNRRVDHRMDRDQPFIDAMIAALAEFWSRVQNDDPPPVGRSDSVKRALAAVYRAESPGKVVELDAALYDADRALVQAKKEKADAEGRILLAENTLKAAMKDAEVAILPDGTTYSLKTTNRAAYMVPASSWRQLRRRAKKEE